MTFGQGVIPQITRSPPQRPQMHNGRRTEHSTTEEEEKVHLHYQSRRRHCTLFFGHPFSSSLPISTGAPLTHTLWTPPFPTTNLHGATNTHSFGHPSSNTHFHGGPTNTLLWTPPIHTTKHHGGHTLFFFGHRSSIYQSPPRHHIHSFCTPLYPSTLPSYGRSYNFDYLSSFV